MIEERRKSSDRRDTEDRRVVNLKALEEMNDEPLKLKNDSEFFNGILVGMGITVFIGFVIAWIIGFS